MLLPAQVCYAVLTAARPGHWCLSPMEQMVGTEQWTSLFGLIRLPTTSSQPSVRSHSRIFSGTPTPAAQERGSMSIRKRQWAEHLLRLRLPTRVLFTQCRQAMAPALISMGYSLYFVPLRMVTSARGLLKYATTALIFKTRCY